VSDFDPDYDGYDGDRQIDMVCIGCRVRLTYEHQLAWCDQADGPVCSMCDDSRRGLLVVHSMTARPGEDAVPTGALGRWPGGES
jgi:hypothetical protein